MNNGRKKRVVLSNKQRGQMRTEYVKRGGDMGTISTLAKEFGVARATASRIISQLKTSKKVTQLIEKKEQELVLKRQILNTIDERTKLITLLKASQIVPIAKKLKAGKEITAFDKIDLNHAITTLERLFKGIDDINKVDIHFHSTKILNVIQNLDEETAKIMFPDLKNMLCNTCPAYIKYGKEM